MSEEGKVDAGSAVKNLSVTPAITALLKPTTEYLGAELRDFVKATVEEWKAKRRERNLEAHLEAVRKKLIEQPPPKAQSVPSLDQLVLFDEWIEKAQDIDPEDKDLSEIWRNLLAKAARGEIVSSDIIATLRSLTPKQAQFLALFQARQIPLPVGQAPGGTFRSKFGAVSTEERYLASALEAKGILERNYAVVLFTLVALGSCGAFAYAYFGKLLADISPPVVIAAAGTFLILLGHLMLSQFTQWNLTWLGRELLKFVSPSRSKARI